MKRLITIFVLFACIVYSLGAQATAPTDESVFDPKTIERYDDGVIKSGVLKKKATFQKIECVPGMVVEFYKNGMLKMLDNIPKGVKIMDIPCSIAWFLEDGGIAKVLLSKNHKIDGKKYKKGEYVVMTPGTPKATYIPE